MLLLCGYPPAGEACLMFYSKNEPLMATNFAIQFKQKHSGRAFCVSVGRVEQSKVYYHLPFQAPTEKSIPRLSIYFPITRWCEALICIELENALRNTDWNVDLATRFPVHIYWNISKLKRLLLLHLKKPCYQIHNWPRRSCLLLSMLLLSFFFCSVGSAEIPGSWIAVSCRKSSFSKATQRL